MREWRRARWAGGVLLRAIPAIAAFGLGGALGGCEPTLLVAIDGEPQVREALAEQGASLRVTFLAARPSDERVCVPVTRQFPAFPELSGNEVDLPLRLRFTAGETFTAWAALRVEARDGSRERLLLHERILEWPASGDEEHEILLVDGCLHRWSSCGEDQHCDEGLCLDREVLAFDDPAEQVEPPVHCDAAAR